MTRSPLAVLGVETHTVAAYTRLSAAVRLVACFTAMHIAYFIDPARVQPLALAPRTLVVLMFSVYAAALYWRVVRDKTHLEPQPVYWIDCLWYLLITALTGGPASQFYFFLAFPLLFVSLRWGFRPGITMAVSVSAILLIAHIALWRRAGGDILSTNILLGPCALLALGYLMATWANTDLMLNRRLAALKDFGTLFNPRYSIEQTIDRVVRHVAAVHQVNKYALLLQDNGQQPKVFRADLPQPMYQVSETTALELANMMSRLHARDAMVYVGKRGLLSAEVFNSSPDAAAHDDEIKEAGSVAKRLDCASFCSVQFELRLGGAGRLIVWADGHYYNSSDLPFFNQLSDLLTPRIENVQLLDRLLAQTAESERQKISRDVHDSAIQPYIGLKFALEGLARKVPPDSPLAADVAHVVEMANSEIQEMRTFVKGLRGDEDPGRAALVPALQRQAARFAELYGIRVAVESPGELRVSDALANEIFHIVSAALSNVRRHTAATRALIKLAADENTFTLQVSNPIESSADVKLFTPRSITERALVLGGMCHVAMEPPGFTTVTVEIPLRESSAS